MRRGMKCSVDMSAQAEGKELHRVLELRKKRAIYGTYTPPMILKLVWLEGCWREGRKAAEKVADRPPRH